MPNLPLGAVIAIDFDKWDVDEEIALIQEAGIGRVQIYRNYPRGRPAAEIRARLDDAGLVADAMHGYIELEILDGPAFDLSAESAADRAGALEIARRETAFARGLGCRDIVVHPVGPGDTEGDAFREAALADSAAELARIGEKADARFLVENMPPPMFGSDGRMLRRIVDAVGSPHLGLAYDSGHANVLGRPVDTVRDMGPRLWGVHLHDNDGLDDDHLLPGMGTVPFEAVARTLAEVGFGATFMLEIYRDTAEVRRDLTAQRLAFIQHLRRLASGEPR